MGLLLFSGRLKALCKLLGRVLGPFFLKCYFFVCSREVRDLHFRNAALKFRILCLQFRDVVFKLRRR